MVRVASAGSLVGWRGSRQLFTLCARVITDDLTVAGGIRRLGGHSGQTTPPRRISTFVRSALHHRRLVHRWFGFSRILVRNAPPPLSSPARSLLQPSSLAAGRPVCFRPVPSGGGLAAHDGPGRMRNDPGLAQPEAHRLVAACPVCVRVAEPLQPAFLAGAFLRPAAVATSGADSASVPAPPHPAFPDDHHHPCRAAQASASSNPGR